jgi:molybdopterin/thiamine biosynthesis adenylyltransferase
MGRNRKFKPGAKVVVVGCGGNIGSHLVPHLARMADVGGVTLIDQDVYEEKNLMSQNITFEDIGRPKVTVQAERFRQINERVPVEALFDVAQNLALGKLRGDVIVGCLDNNAARLYLSEASWRLGGIPYIDAGVQGEGFLARVNIYKPGVHAPCLECAWDSRDYERIQHTYPCQDGGASPGATNSPSSLGSMAASLQAIECWKVLTGLWEQAAVGRQVLIDALNHKHYLSSLRRSAHCRFDHEIWKVEQLSSGPGGMSLGQALTIGCGSSDPTSSAGLRVEGLGTFMNGLSCSSCGVERALLHLQHRLKPQQMVCRHCGSRMAAAGFDMFDTLNTARLSPPLLRRSLESLGFMPDDVFTVAGPKGERHFQIGSGKPAKGKRSRRQVQN